MTQMERIREILECVATASEVADASRKARQLLKEPPMQIPEDTDTHIKTIIENTIKHCGGTPDPMELDLASTMIEHAMALAFTDKEKK